MTKEQALDAVEKAIDKAFERIKETYNYGAMLRFSTIDDDSAEALVIDYYAMKWLSNNGYYKDGQLNEQCGMAPILTAVKWAKSQIDTTDGKMLLSLLEKRVTGIVPPETSESSGESMDTTNVSKITYFDPNGETIVRDDVKKIELKLSKDKTELTINVNRWKPILM